MSKGCSDSLRGCLVSGACTGSKRSSTEVAKRSVTPNAQCCSYSGAPSAVRDQLCAGESLCSRGSAHAAPSSCPVCGICNSTSATGRGACHLVESPLLMAVAQVVGLSAVLAPGAEQPDLGQLRQFGELSGAIESKWLPEVVVWMSTLPKVPPCCVVEQTLLYWYHGGLQCITVGCSVSRWAAWLPSGSLVAP